MNNLQKHLGFFLLLVLLWNSTAGTICQAAVHSSEQWYLDEIGLPCVSSDCLLPDTDSVSDNYVTIAVIDTGTLLSHPALKSSLWINECEKSGTTGIDDDGNGYVDDIYGYNVKGDNGDVTVTDGHGTHVAGIIAMRPTDSDTAVGIYPDVRIMTVKAGNTTNGFSSANLMKAINYALENKADVINLSLGTSFCNEGLRELLSFASQSSILVAAAGNGSLPTKESPADTGENIYPAAHPDVIGVMSFNQQHELSWFSNWDRMPCHEEDYELIAPGDDIYSTTLRNKYKMESGTSMSAPMVSAACGILIAKWRSLHSPDSSFPVASIKDCLLHGTKESIVYVDSNDHTLMYPRLDIENALRYMDEHYLTGSVSENNESVSGNTPVKESVSDNTSGETSFSDANDSISENTPRTDPSDNVSPSPSPVGDPKPVLPVLSDGQNRPENNSFLIEQQLIHSIQSAKPVIGKKKLFRIKKGFSTLTGQSYRFREWNRTRLTFRLKKNSPDGWYIYRSSSKNGKYRLYKILKGNRIILKKTKRHYYYYIKAYKKTNGKSYLSRRSRKIRI